MKDNLKFLQFSAESPASGTLSGTEFEQSPCLPAGKPSETLRRKKERKKERKREAVLNDPLYNISNSSNPIWHDNDINNLKDVVEIK